MQQRLREIATAGARTTVREKPMSLVLCDVEGCLTFDPLTYDHLLLEELRRVNEAATWSNALPFLTLCTGRQAHFVEAFCGFLSVRIPAIFEGGCGLFLPLNRPGTRHRWHPLIADATDQQYVDFRETVLDAAGKLDLAPSLGKGRLMTFRVPPGRSVTDLASELTSALSTTSAAVTHSADAIDVAPGGIRKADAIPWMLEEIEAAGGPRLTAGQLVGIGDAPNDVSFLEIVGRSVAPANADESVRAVVDSPSSYTDAKAVAEAVIVAVETNASAAAAG
jgi:hydroxymethylpyrimidine pyrophosphatase-like HAD family hydrolase